MKALSATMSAMKSDPLAGRDGDEMREVSRVSPGRTPPTPSAGDTAHALVKGALNALPLAGGLVAEVFGLIVKPPLQRRLADFMQGIADDLERLREAGRVDFEKLKSNEEFVSAVGCAAGTVLHCHQKEKLDALRNAVLNSALPGAPVADVQAMYLHFIDYLTPWHIRLLAILQDPVAWQTRNAIRLPKGSFVENILSTVESAFCDLKGQNDMSRVLIRDLHDRGLTVLDLQALILDLNTSPNGPNQGWTTPFGDEFLRFITAPKLRV